MWTFIVLFWTTVNYRRPTAPRALTILVCEKMRNMVWLDDLGRNIQAFYIYSIENNIGHAENDIY